MPTACRLAALALVLVFVAGCSGTYVPKDRYTQDIKTLQDYITALERRNQELEAENTALRRFAADAEIVTAENQFYEQMARQIEGWLKAAQLDSADIRFKDGKWEITGDVLFESGSFNISANGRKILNTLSSAYKSKSINFRIVGHTDRDPIAKSSTKKKLFTDTNLELSALRAVAVAEVFRNNGIALNRMAVEGRGNTQPKAPNDNNPANKRKNRRVEIYVLNGTPGK